MAAAAMVAEARVVAAARAAVAPAEEAMVSEARAVAAMAADRLEEMGATADREVVEALEALGEVKVVEEMEMAMAVQMEGAMAAGTVEAVMVVVMVAEVCQAM